MAWLAHALALRLEGFDLAPVTGAKATGRRIHSLGGAIDRAFCRVAALEDSGLPDSSAHGIVCVDALGRAADQDAAVRELGRVRVPRFSGSPTALSVPADRMEGMTIKDVTRHDIAEERIEDTLQRGIRQAIGHWSDMRHGSRPLRQGLREMCGDLLDLAAARTLEDPALDTPTSREVLLTAAECALGELTLGCFPDGDWDVPLPLVDETLTSEEMHYEETWEPASPATTAQTWVRAFALCVISGLVWERSRVIGPMLHEDYAPAIHDGVPYSKRESVSTPADLAEMDALCDYLTVVQGRYPGALPGPVPLDKPDADARARAAERLDAAGTLDPDQRLLRVLLDDDQAVFEQALAERLLEHRADVGTDPAPRTLLPVRTAAVAALASLAHGWQLGIRSAYLPESLLHAPQH